VEQSAFEATQILARRGEKLSTEVEAAKEHLQEPTARLQKVKAGLLEEAEAEGQVGSTPPPPPPPSRACS